MDVPTIKLDLTKISEETKMNEPISYIFEEVSIPGENLKLENVSKDSFSNYQKTFKMITPKIPDVKIENVVKVKPGFSFDEGVLQETKRSGGRKTRKRKHKRKSKKRKAKKKSRVKRKRKSRKKIVGGHDHGLHLGGGKFLLGGGI